jgi:predicted MFS family arabinose efflux permease
MSLRQLKNGYFTLEGINSFATVYFFYYFYFYMHQAFGFDNKANLVLAGLNGATYAVGAWWAGKFAQRFGGFAALKLGYGTMAVALALGSQARSAPAAASVMLLCVVGMCFTWPTLEALTTEGEPPDRLPHLVGVYNIVWAGTGAIANFVGGAMLDKLGAASLFCIPMSLHLCQLGLTLWLEREARGVAHSVPVPAAAEALPKLNPRPIAKARKFRRMAWLANPFAYIAIQTVIALMPGLAKRLELSATMAGFFGSIWCFGRLGAFLGLWLWTDWHYRFRWLCSGFLALVGSFALILMVPQLAVLIAAQVIFGAAVGLLYYSSLFYAMDMSDTKSEHGGIHEAVIGLGNFAGPTVGAASLYFLPQYTNSGAVAVSVLLLCGLGGLVAVWRSGP